MNIKLGQVVGVLTLGIAVGCGNSSDPGSGSPGTAGAGESGGSAAGSVDSADAGAATAGTSGGLGSAGTVGEAEGGLGGDSGDSGDSPEAGSGGLGGNSGMAGSLEPGPQQRSDKLDVLFVVDSSTSMADKQSLLTASLPSFIRRLANPWCVEESGLRSAQQPTSGALGCITGSREFTPVMDAHFGVITTSIGSHGGPVCGTASATVAHPDDRAELIGVRDNLKSYRGEGYLAFDPSGSAGDSNLDSVVADLQAMVTAAGESGCGYEAPFEAMYRFLVDPEPPLSIEQVNAESVRTGLNQALLAQRSAFLRPDSALAVVILSDESDCSIVDEGPGWFVASNSRMPRATTSCDADANDRCCRSCASVPTDATAGCVPLDQDEHCKLMPAGGSYATWDASHDSLNLRCYAQKQRFGFDLLYPVARYTNALSNAQVTNRAGQLVDNPLFAARDGKGPRSPSLISVSVIVGAPWQDLATKASLEPGQPLEYLDASGLVANQRWSMLLGERDQSSLPSDPFMVESVLPRVGSHPLTHTLMGSPTSLNPQESPINGHEQPNSDFSDLQYACTFALASPRLCAAGDPTCDCASDKSGNQDALVASNSPLCQPPSGGPASNTQYYGKGYPGPRELEFARQLGERATAASICPKTLADPQSADYAYKPALSSFIRRIAQTLR